MVDFNELYITKDGNTLVVRATVKGTPGTTSATDGTNYWANVYIDRVQIDSSSTRIESGPSSTPIYTYSTDSSSRLKTIVLQIPVTEILTDTDNDMLFVYVVTKGTPTSGVPCGMDNKTTEGCVVNMYKIYQQSLPYLKKLDSKCCIQKDFINLILQIKGLEIAMKTNHYSTAIKLWKEFFQNTEQKITSNCNCHG